MNSQQALARIVEGVAKFKREVYPQQRAVFDRLSNQQHPIAMFFTCADSRIVPNLVLQSGPGEVFIERTPGNIVPKYSDHVGGVTASMEFAVTALRIPQTTQQGERGAVREPGAICSARLIRCPAHSLKPQRAVVRRGGSGRWVSRWAAIGRSISRPWMNGLRPAASWGSCPRCAP